MKVFLSALGCKLNQSETESLARDLAARGHEVVCEPCQADTIVLNTCSVTHVAARKSTQLARRLLRDSPNARLVLTGCFAELSGDEAAALPGRPVVVGNRDKARLADVLSGVESRGGRLTAADVLLRHPAGIPGLRTRAWVKIQDGCDNECSYCVVRIARGAQHSRPVAEIINEVRLRLTEGYREIVLTGVHIGAFGRDRGTVQGVDLWTLVRRLLDETDVPRLRLSSIEPWDIGTDDLRIFSERRLCRQIHLPMQSGSDPVLARMGRRYAIRDFVAIAEAARRVAPHIALTTDVIVGFPGETDDEFAQTVRLIEQIGFARLHVFPYSRRPGTVAAAYPDQVPAEIKQARSEALIELGRRQAEAFRRQFVGQVLDVLFETRNLAGDWSGLTDNYIRVWVQHEGMLRNRIEPVRLVAAMPGGLRGIVVESPRQPAKNGGGADGEH